MTLFEYYQKKCLENNLIDDAEQRSVVRQLDEIGYNLTIEADRRTKYRFLKRRQLVKGLYLWGGVGIGKTFLLDAFFQAVPIEQKQRFHFHDFMRLVHHELKENQGRKDPLVYIAKKMAKQTILFCFDEFFVTDIVDAIILGKFIQALFDAGVCMVMTSNIAPDDLYLRGLQRPLFLPAIVAIKKHTSVMHLPTRIDYRARIFSEKSTFFLSQHKTVPTEMSSLFTVLTQGMRVDETALIINDRKIPVIAREGDVVWFSFKALCSPPRSQVDYLEIAEQFHVIFLSDIPAIPAKDHNTIILFIRLIDILYDKKIALVFSAEVPINEIYKTGRMETIFLRTVSRLLEMQSMEYFARKS